MKRIFLLISLFVIATTLAYSLAPVTVVLNNDGDNLTAQLNDYSNGNPVPVNSIGLLTIPTITPNGSGVSSFVVGQGEEDWGNIPPSAVNSSVILDIYDNGVLTAQFRLDQLIERTARTERLPIRVRVGEIKADSAATFEQQVEIKGPLVLSIGTFSSSFELDTLKTNIMSYTGYSTLTVTENSQFGPPLTNGATYTIVNNGGGTLGINLIYGGNASLSVGQSASIVKVNNYLYFVSKP